MIRVGAVDLGTNSTRLLIADVDDGTVTPIVRRTVVTRLGEGVDARRILLPIAIARVRNTLVDFRREAVALGAVRVLAVATSAVRDAENGEAFLGEIERSFQFTTRLLSGDDEAALTRRGIGPLGERTLLLDVGGGSTEITAGSFRRSFDVGSVRLTERHLDSDPPTAAELAAARADVRDLLPELDVIDAVGVAGTVAQLEAIVGDLTTEAVDTTLALLASLPTTERALVPGMDPARAPVVVGGALIVAEVLHRYNLARIAYSERDILDGAALAAAELGPMPDDELPLPCC
ncbi:MAG: hypothetical protein F2663_03835 [Actinobacteria bacterium]|uniref:Unannotated protein n=1 Tax=freshwater metagenome TaxID=449393 RepID=A0A6J6NY61_9ZZZZ|nr:hypothetical protein [Actinomycetota bacterium]